MDKIKKKGELFAGQLLHWNKYENNREMPWKGEKDPYKIWLSEIILQQTRVEQGLKYYENFIREFPDINALAAATDAKVFKLWEGLGYYSRCKNLIATAKFISTEFNGRFPDDFQTILKLKGIGPYTAAAIASFAYNLPYAVLDGNVFRVLSRIFDIDAPIDSRQGKNLFNKMAQDILPPDSPALYNQAIMDFGALICKPLPSCLSCFFSKECTAYNAGRQDLLPVKLKKARLTERWFNYVVPVWGDQVLIHQRVGKDIWQQLYEFLLIETGKRPEDKQLKRLLKEQYGINEIALSDHYQRTQRLSHQLIHFSITKLKLDKKLNLPGFSWININEIDQYPFPKTLHDYINEKEMI
ncbi:MAG TPA: A/G-specific adenine glycosylase [Flavisolibacter sp.]|nr:A/G-specific adenine glycosylase [Flavisolibacter sp.]